MIAKLNLNFYEVMFTPIFKSNNVRLNFILYTFIASVKIQK